MVGHRLVPQAVREEFDQIKSQLHECQLVKLKGWRLVIDTRPQSRLGQCCYRTQEIAISAWLIDLNGADHPQVVDTLRHEVAHVLAGPGTRHGPIWKRYARALRATPKSCCDVAREGLVTPRMKKGVEAKCEHCGEVHRRLRLPSRPLACLRCMKRRKMIHGNRAKAFNETRLSWRKTIC